MHCRKTFRDFAESVLGALFRLEVFLRDFFFPLFFSDFSLAVIEFALQKIIETCLTFRRRLVNKVLGIWISVTDS